MDPERRIMDLEQQIAALLRMNSQLAAEVDRCEERIDEMEAALRAAEWMLREDDTMLVCPQCWEWQRDGHAADCIVGRALGGE